MILVKEIDDLHDSRQSYWEPDFDDPAKIRELLTPMPEGEGTRQRPPTGLPPYFHHLWDVPLLTANQERHLFRQFNYFRYLGWKEEVRRVRDRLIRANLRLVVSIAKRYADGGTDAFDELICIGNAALVRAVDLFDIRRGHRFSTYAYQAVQRSIYDDRRREQRHRDRVVADGNVAAGDVVGDAGDCDRQKIDAMEAQNQASRLMAELDDRDRYIVMARFGMNRPETHVAFHVIAREVGISTTRTVQLFNRSLAKMRESGVG